MRLIYQDSLMRETKRRTKVNNFRLFCQKVSGKLCAQEVAGALCTFYVAHSKKLS